MNKTALTTAALTLSLAFSQVSFAELTVKVHGSGKAAPSRSNSVSADEDRVTSQQVNDQDDADEDQDPPIEAVRHFGSKGDTTSEQRQWTGRHGVVDMTVTDKAGTARIEGETVTGEYRSRNYTEKGFLKRTVGTQHQASLVRSRYGTSYDSPSAKVGDVDVLQYHNESEVEGFVGAQADAEAGFDLASTDPRAEARAGVFVGARVDARASQRVDVLGASASTAAEGSASVGAEAAVEGSVSKEGVKVGAGAFAGARAKGSVGGEVGGVGATGTGEAWAGVGAEADATTKFENGKLTLGTEAGAGLGVGGKVGYEATLDVNKVHKDGTALVNNGGKLVKQLDKPVTVKLPKISLDSQRTPSHTTAPRWVAKATERSLRQTQQTLARPRQLTRRAAGARKQTADTVRQVSKDADRLARTTSKSIADAGSAGRKAGNSVKKTVGKAGKSAKKATKRVGKSVKKLFK